MYKKHIELLRNEFYQTSLNCAKRPSGEMGIAMKITDAMKMNDSEIEEYIKKVESIAIKDYLENERKSSIQPGGNPD